MDIFFFFLPELFWRRVQAGPRYTPLGRACYVNSIISLAATHRFHLKWLFLGSLDCSV